MPQTHQELLEKFDVVTNWMIEDTKKAMFDAHANFLVAQGLLNYTEILGSFIQPEADPGERFDIFLSRMGAEYQRLLRRHNGYRGRRQRRPHVIYDDLRCGLTHEYTIKRKKFIIYNSDHPLTDNEINNLSINLSGTLTRCTAGILHSTEHWRGVWHFVDPKYWLDFRFALEQYKTDIRNPSNTDIRNNFFRQARRINLLNFSI